MKQKSSGTKRVFDKERLIWLVASIVLALIIFVPSLQNDFVNWDDQLYVFENPLITDLTGNFARMIIEPVAGNYHPVTVISLAIDYSIAGLNASQYHLSSLIIHLFNIGLVFWLVYLLTGKNTFIAGFGALFFAIHPMHVEAVSWVSSRKDVLYTSFFLLSLITYLKYLSGRSWVLLGASLVLFVLSCAAKPAAVVLPLVLLLIDYFQARPLNLKLALEKAPYFAISLAFGLLTIGAQSEGGAVGDFETYTIGQRLLFACYGPMMYLAKAVVPMQLSSFYSYPRLSEGLPYVYYVGPVAALLFAGVLVYFRRERIVVFSLLFFIVNLLLVLQFFTVGSAIMADRYTYIPYISLYLLLGWGLDQLMQKQPKLKIPVLAGIAAIAIVYSFIAYQRTKVWKNGETLWTDVINKEPHSRNYAALADYYKDERIFDKALANYTQAISLRPDKYDHYGDRGTMYFQMQNYPAAIEDFKIALQLKPDAYKVHRNLGSAYGASGNYNQSLVHFNKALELEPGFDEALLDRGNLYIYMQNYDAAIADFNAYLATNPVVPSFKVYNGLGVSLYYKNDCQQAVFYYTKALEVNPQDAQTYFNRSACYSNLGNKQQALTDALTAQRLGMAVDENYLQNLR